MFSKVKTHRSLVEEIVADLEQRIIAEGLKPNQRIIEAELCEKMGVSRSPLREAFRILESQGFLRREPRRGVFVTGVTPDEIRDVYQIRANLESLATYLAVEKRDPKVLEELKRLHAQMIEEGQNSNFRAYLRLNLKFHETVVNASGNNRLIELINNFVKQTRRFRLKVLTLPGKIQASIQNHERLIQSFEDGDAASAERLRKETILANVDALYKYVKDEQDENRP